MEEEKNVKRKSDGDRGKARANEWAFTGWSVLVLCQSMFPCWCEFPVISAPSEPALYLDLEVREPAYSSTPITLPF